MEKSGLSKYIVVALLIVGAFYLGSLNKRVSTLEKGGKQNGNVQGTEDTNAKDNNEPAAFNTSELVNLAGKIGLNTGDFEKCLTSDEIKTEVSNDESTGSAAGVTGTPGVFIYDNQTGNIARIPGAVPYTILKPIVEKMLTGISEADKKTDEKTGIEYTDKSKLTLPAVQVSDYVKGNKDARFSLIQYSDIDCPYCKKFHPTAQQLVDEYNGQVNWIYRQFPLDQLHPNARIKAQGARCVGKLGGAEAFWKYLDEIAQ